jgi:hypothetical protein
LFSLSIAVDICRMNASQPQENVWVLQIETATCVPSYDNLDPIWKEWWCRKMNNRKGDETFCPSSSYASEAGLHPEFSKIICIGLKPLHDDFPGVHQGAMLFYDTQEDQLLRCFHRAVDQIQSSPIVFAGHHIRDFALPFLYRRAMVNNIPVSGSLDFREKKPWEWRVLDTMLLWKLNDPKHPIPFDVLTALFGITTAGKALEGTMIGGLFWETDVLKHAMNRSDIMDHCENKLEQVSALIRRMVSKRETSISAF